MKSLLILYGKKCTMGNIYLNRKSVPFTRIKYYSVHVKSVTFLFFSLVICFGALLDNLSFSFKISVSNLFLLCNIDSISSRFLNKSITVSGISKGKGFSGTVKRYGFSLNNKTHGNSKAHRKPGSIGMCQDPGRVFKGKKMAGIMGGKKISIRNLKILFFNKNYLYIKGSIPGSYGPKLILKGDI